MALAGKETFLTNLDQQNLAAFEDLSRWKLPKSLPFSFLLLLFFKSPFLSSHTPKAEEAPTQFASLSCGLRCMLQVDRGSTHLPMGMT